ncbi:hypothetical protein CMUS01_13599 [Colletotrichum musicola]|uniref:Peptidase C14 caspase domain-containing protein n=1 Tax=Colletotrichum musicola TaxID=2175873 RepID=A0A8H6JB07_9PEZI|nr:hypothetical protein CMUS01_13599 [Colletotrichum musicola]
MSEGSTQGRKSALLIGIDKYSCTDLHDLHGCLNDVHATEEFLTRVAGISSITKLTSPPGSPNDTLPTFDNIVSAFQTLANGAQPDDFIYIHYSGHGTRRSPTKFPDLQGEDTRYEECLVVLASSHGQLEYLFDVEIAFLLKQIADKGATVTFVLDCCHSGGATRGDDTGGDRVRGSDDIPDESYLHVNRKPIRSVEDLEDAWGPPPNDSDNAGRGGSVVQHWLTASKGINSLAACRPEQNAQEVPHRGKVRSGLFTECLASVVNARNGNADGLHRLSCDVVSNLVVDKIKRKLEQESGQDQDVVPGGQGDCYIFGVGSVVQLAVVVTSVETSPRGKRKQLIVGLTAGVAHGVSLDDIFAIYPSDRRLASVADYSRPLANCTVTAVENFSCKAITFSNDADHALEQVQAGCAAVSVSNILEKHVLQQSKGAWVSAADDGAGPPDPLLVQNVRDCIKNHGKGLVNLQEAGEAFFKVMVQQDGSFTIFFTPNQAEVKVEVTGEFGPEEVLSRPVHLTVFYNLFNLAKDNAGQQEERITVSKIGFLDQGVEPPAPRQFRLDGALGIKVRNTSLDDVYVEILDLEPSWQVKRTYPKARHDPILTPHKEGVRFFIKMYPSVTVPGAVQPDIFDRFLVLATSRYRHNFPTKVLLPLGRRGRGPVLEPDDGNEGRAGDGVSKPLWFVQQLDVRVVVED